jgi:hypothetical protein
MDIAICLPSHLLGWRGALGVDTKEVAMNIQEVFNLGCTVKASGSFNTHRCLGRPRVSKVMS